MEAVIGFNEWASHSKERFEQAQLDRELIADNINPKISELDHA